MSAVSRSRSLVLSGNLKLDQIINLMFLKPLLKTAGAAEQQQQQQQCNISCIFKPDDHRTTISLCRGPAVNSRRAYIAALSFLIGLPQPRFMMASTVHWEEETSSEFRTERHSSEDATVLSERASLTQSSMLPHSIALLLVGVLGTVACGLVLVGFWLSDRSKLTQSSILITNHTTLDLLISSLTFSRPSCHCFLPPTKMNPSS